MQVSRCCEFEKMCEKLEAHVNQRAVTTAAFAHVISNEWEWGYEPWASYPSFQSNLQYEGNMRDLLI